LCSVYLLDSLVRYSLLYNILKHLLVINYVKVLSVDFKLLDEFAYSQEQQLMNKLDLSSVLCQDLLFYVVLSNLVKFVVVV